VVHAAEVRILDHAFAGVTTTYGVIAMLADAVMRNSRAQP
jgi:hypothetical protein